MPKKLFISYPSESWNFAQRIAENLANRLDDTIFIDYSGIDRADFEVAILSHLRTSDCVILVVTEYTFADIHRDADWVRREIRTALENNIPIVLVRENGLLPPRDLPSDVVDVNRSQGVPFYKEFFDAGVIRLVEFLVKMGVGTVRTPGSEPKPIESVSSKPSSVAQPTVESVQRTIGGQSSLDEAADLLESGDHEKALVILETLHDQGSMRPVFANMVNTLLGEAQTQRATADRRREAALDYATIAAMAKRRFTEARAGEEFHAWCERFPELVDALDEANLREKYPLPKKPRGAVSLLPAPFAWVPIPAGRVKLITEQGWDENYIPKGQSRTFDVPAFAMGKYPVTNAQYAPFVEAGGYAEHKWWTPVGWEQRQKDGWTEPHSWRDAKWNGAELPVVGVSWYEAVAYCRWLSHETGEKILLPTEQQWQRAAQGDDDRQFPWGNDWDCSRCNNSVLPCGSNVTTSVVAYEGKGDSPLGVVDMVGNVWEWCLTTYERGSIDVNGTDVRMLRGGSWNHSLMDGFRCDFRIGYSPGGRYFDWGFRLALSL
jgi:formylglycine-generating enzyme required for sulfatase activity